MNKSTNDSKPSATYLIEQMDVALKENIMMLDSKLKGIQGEVSSKLNAYEKHLIKPKSEDHVDKLKQVSSDLQDALDGVRRLIELKIGAVSDQEKQKERFNVLNDKIKSKLDFLNEFEHDF